MALILIRFISILFQLINAAIIIRVLLSWFNIRPDHPVLIFLDQITEPILGPIRRIVPTIGMLDISPIIAIVLLELVRTLLVNIIVSVL